MLDSIYHMTLKLLKTHILGVKTFRFCHTLCTIIMEVIMLITKSVNHQWFIYFIARHYITDRLDVM